MLVTSVGGLQLWSMLSPLPPAAPAEDQVGQDGTGRDGVTSQAAQACQRDNGQTVFPGSCVAKGLSCSSLACKVLLFLYGFLRNNKISRMQTPFHLIQILPAGQNL